MGLYLKCWLGPPLGDKMKPTLPHSQTRQSDGSWLLESKTFLDYPIEEVFRFFQDAHNLQVLTPEFLGFEVLTPQPIEMKAGVLIDYRIRLHGIPLRWRTQIIDWNPPFSFVDQQLRGPYRQWHHTHEFESLDGGTICTDRVRYRVFGGAIIQRLFVRSDVDRIFRYRAEKLLDLFPPKGSVKTI